MVSTHNILVTLQNPLNFLPHTHKNATGIIAPQLRAENWINLPGLKCFLEVKTIIRPR